jgi:hypothetical protein
MAEKYTSNGLNFSRTYAANPPTPRRQEGLSAARRKFSTTNFCRGGFNETSGIPTDNLVKPAPTNQTLICNNDANGLDIRIENFS